MNKILMFRLKPFILNKEIPNFSKIKIIVNGNVSPLYANSQNKIKVQISKRKMHLN